MYKKESWINKNNPFMFNKTIIEYDMKEAGFSLIKEFNLLPDSVIDKLKEKPKSERTISIGMIQRDNRELAENLSLAFQSARKMFFESNQLEYNDIVSVKKDAIFTSRPVDSCEFGKYIKFRKKNQYTSYLYLGKALELYYSPSHLDIKGINDSKIKLHEGYMVDLFKKYFHKAETESPEVLLDFMRRFTDKYKRKELDIGYYRTFDNRSALEIYRNGELMLFDKYMENDKEDISIDFNFFNVLLKLMRIPL